MTWLPDYKTVLFDVDGTVLDTLTDLTNAYNVTLAYFGLAQVTQKQVAHYFGNGVRYALEQSFDSNQLDQALVVFNDYYGQHRNDHTAPYEGILSLFEKLHQAGKKIGLVSNKLNEDLQAISQRCFGQQVDFVIGQVAHLARKPAPDMVYAALEVLGGPALYVGDTEVDVQTGKAAGLPVIGVTWGFREASCLEGVDYLVHTPSELANLLISFK